MARKDNIITIEISEEDRELLLALLGKTAGSAAVDHGVDESDEIEADEEEEGEDDGAFTPVTEEELRDISFAELKTYAVDEWEIDPAGKKTTGLVKAILEAQEEYVNELGDDVPDDVEDDEDDEGTEEIEDEEEDEEEDDESEDVSDEFWTEKELNSKTIGELKAIARDYEISTKGMKSPEIVSAIIDA